MIDLSKRRYGHSTKALIPEGTYTGTIVSVHWSESHDEKAAYVIEYEIFDPASDKRYVHQEVFFNDTDNIRTADFERLINKHGVKSLYDLVGMKQNLTFKHERRHNRTFSNIVEREFVA